MPLPDVTRYFHPVLAASALRRKPVGVALAGQRYALWRTSSGQAAAVTDSCPHRLAPLSRGRVRADGRLACAYHGWHFDGEGRGQSPSEPTRKGCDTAALQVVERHGYLWLASPATPLSAMPQLGWDGFQHAGSFTVLFQAPLHVALDNFSEDEHLPFVHDFLGWDESAIGQVEFDCATHPDHSETSYRGPQRRSPWLRLLGVRAGDRFQNEWTTRFDPVHAVFTFHWFDQKTGAERPLVLRTGVFMVPETETTTRFHVLVFVRIAPSWLAHLRPLVHRVATLVGRREVARDAGWVAHLAHTPLELRGMKLSRFDRAVAHNRRLLASCYWGNAAEPQPV